jgi:hypothetical protein
MQITLRTLALIYRTEGFRQAVRSALYFGNPWRAKGRCILLVRTA